MKNRSRYVKNHNDTANLFWGSFGRYIAHRSKRLMKPQSRRRAHEGARAAQPMADTNVSCTAPSAPPDLTHVVIVLVVKMRLLPSHVRASLSSSPSQSPSPSFLSRRRRRRYRTPHRVCRPVVVVAIAIAILIVLVAFAVVFVLVVFVVGGGRLAFHLG